MATDPHVLVVGAGPVGLFMAAELCRYGVSCRIIDKNSGPSGQSRATTIQPRTLEVLEALGLVKKFVATGMPCHTIGTYTPQMKVLQHVNYAELDSSFPFALSLPQSKTEQLLTHHLASFGQVIEWGGVNCAVLSRMKTASPWCCVMPTVQRSRCGCHISLAVTAPIVRFVTHSGCHLRGRITLPIMRSPMCASTGGWPFRPMRFASLSDLKG